MSREQGAYEELQYYTLGHGDHTFIHQHAVDAWAAQHADHNTKPITLAFALVGLYLSGEVLDAFGPIGGHNFLWAWATGRAAGIAAASHQSGDSA